MAEKNETAKQPDHKQVPPKAGAAKNAREIAQEQMRNDPSLAKYHALLVQERDKKVLENSLLISLCFFLVMLFIIFPEFASKIIGAEQKEDIIEIPKQTVVKQEQKQEQRQEIQRREEQRERDFSQIPDISRPTGDERIVEDIKIDRLHVKTEDFDDLDFGDLPSSTPGPIEVAGNVVRPEVTFRGPQPFPQKAKILRRSGRVKVRLIIRKNGEYEVVRIMEENPPDFGFGEACIQYLGQSTWKPATQNGRPIDVYFELTIMFNLKS
jgi:hypothetical protein